jgi:hypothetical protein
MGELLKQFDGRGDHRKSGGAPTSSQREVAQHAGISKDQQVQAVRVANIPAEKFEAAIEQPTPAKQPHVEAALAIVGLPCAMCRA